MLASLTVLLGGGALIAVNWAPEEKLGTLEAPRFDSSLAGGGLSSRALGPDVLIDSLASIQPVGYQILTDATDEDVIGEFTQRSSQAPWTSEFQMDDGDFRLRFKGDRAFLLNYPIAREEIANELFEISRRYGFYSDQTSAELDSLVERTHALDDDFFDRPITFGVPEPDLNFEASDLAADWDTWIQTYGEHPETAQWAEAQRKVALVIAEVCRNPTQSGLNEYNRTADEWTRAIRLYNQSL